jgi:hypothetical protein
MQEILGFLAFLANVFLAFKAPFYWEGTENPRSNLRSPHHSKGSRAATVNTKNECVIYIWGIVPKIG